MKTVIRSGMRGGLGRESSREGELTVELQKCS